MRAFVTSNIDSFRSLSPAILVRPAFWSRTLRRQMEVWNFRIRCLACLTGVHYLCFVVEAYREKASNMAL
jgi:hypothetical protein